MMTLDSIRDHISGLKRKNEELEQENAVLRVTNDELHGVIFKLKERLFQMEIAYKNEREIVDHLRADLEEERTRANSR